MTSSCEERLFINNEFRTSKSVETITVQNPFDHSVVASGVQCAGAEDIDDAVAAASAAFKTWRKTKPAERSRLMTRLAALIDEHAAELGKPETAAMGAPAFVAEHGAHNLAEGLRYYAGWTDKLAGETFPEAGDGVYRLVTYEPLGVCAGIAAWNGTFTSVAWKVVPAIAAGNTFIFKASEKAPLGVLVLAKLVVEAGFPPGVINFVNGTGEAGQRLAAHPGIAKISFTGSTATGRKVQVAAANSNLKRCTLELGGKSAALVFADADVENALGNLSQGFLINSTQVCAATTRLLVQKSIAEKLIGLLKGRFEAVATKMGDPKVPGTFMGPVADEEQFRRIMGFLEQAQKEGIQVLTGGHAHGEQGYFVQPTILVDPPLDSSVYRDEIFGPVLCIRTFETEEEAIALANDTIYGLGASVFTSDIGRALRVSAELSAGSVGINRGVVPDNRVPFGGVKGSGYGRENGRAGIMAYVDSKTVSINVMFAPDVLRRGSSFKSPTAQVDTETGPSLFLILWPFILTTDNEATSAIFSAVSSLGLPSKENRLIQHYAKNVARLAIAIDYDGNGYRRLVAVALNDQALLYALLALSASHMNRWQKRPDEQPRLYLRQSLQHLQRRLTKPALARSEVTLMTLLVLLTFELCEGGDGWKHHYNGTLAWIRSRQDCSDVDPFLTSVLSMIATQVLLHNPGATRNRSHQFLDEIADLRSNNPASVDVIFGCSLDLPQLIIEATHLHEEMREAQRAQDDNLLRRVYLRAAALQTHIQASRVDSPPQFSMLGRKGDAPASLAELCPADPFEETELREAARASAEIFRLAVQIYVFRIIHDPMTTGRCPYDIREAIDRAFEYFPLIPDTVGPGAFLGWALVVIGAEIDALDRREHVRRRLQSLVLLALNHGTLGLVVLDEVWRRRDAVVAGTSNNRRCRWQEVMEDMNVDLALI
ncbi:aldehyde dehydrogenase family-domain-containing protein [Whalleya microplaca]|nr:aldehyde dehydrogenase family-domain-containing protein [Whalleya microplaca]